MGGVTGVAVELAGFFVFIEDGEDFFQDGFDGAEGG